MNIICRLENYRGSLIKIVISLLLFAAVAFSHPLMAADVIPVSSSTPTAFNVESATRAYLDQLTAAQKARSEAYFEGGYWLQLWQFLWGAGVALFLLEGRWSARMRDLSSRITRRRGLQSMVFGAFYILAIAILSFPLTLYADFFREHKYGLATQGFGGWMRDQLVGLVVSMIFGSVFMGCIMMLVRKLKNSWHIWGAAVAIGFAIIGIIIGPVYIAPMFNQYTLLSDPKVLKPILSLAHANGINTDKVYEMDASRQTTKVSANVSGCLGTMRITLNDNLLNRCSLPEIEAVMAHEMGHYVMNHIYKLLLFLCVVIALGFNLVRFFLERLVNRFGMRWGIAGVGDDSVIPLALLIFSTYFFVLTPMMNTVIRTQEMEADQFGLNAARQPDGFAKAALKLSDYRKMEPGSVEEWIFYDHPSGATRIRTAMRWKAENLDSLASKP